MQHTPIEVLKAKSTEQKREKKGRGEVMGEFFSNRTVDTTLESISKKGI
jgi:hypothetical protein